MYVARQKKEENISEYILYLWQVEDIVRALNYDPQKISDYVSNSYALAEPQRNEVSNWYHCIANELRENDSKRLTHCKAANEALEQVQELHKKLLKSPTQLIYSTLYRKTLPYIVQLRTLSGTQDDEAPCDIETAFIAVYGYVTLKMQGREISEKTTEAMKHISTFLAMLADRYHAVKNGEIHI